MHALDTQGGDIVGTNSGIYISGTVNINVNEVLILLLMQPVKQEEIVSFGSKNATNIGIMGKLVSADFCNRYRWI